MGTGDPWVVLQHVAFEGPGALGLAIAATGAPLSVVRLDLGQPVPAPADLAAARPASSPWADPWACTTTWPGSSPNASCCAPPSKTGLPVLGVCLGAQQLAAALGAEVMEGPAPEVGVGEVHLTTDALHDPVFGAGPDAAALRALARRHLLPARGRGAPRRQRGLREPGLPGGRQRLRAPVPRRGHRRARGPLGPAPAARRVRARLGRGPRQPGRRGHRAPLRRPGRRPPATSPPRRSTSHPDAGQRRHRASPRPGPARVGRGAPSRHDVVPGGREDLRHDAARGRSPPRLPRRRRQSRPTAPSSPPPSRSSGGAPPRKGCRVTLEGGHHRRWCASCSPSRGAAGRPRRCWPLLERREGRWPSSPLSPPSGAARTAGSRRGGSTPPPSACRCARSPGTR